MAKQRRIHALKVGIGVLLALQFVLLQPLDTYFQHTGAWAVITVAVVVLQTPGETTNKMLNRTIGTIIAAIVAIFCGIIGSHEILSYPFGHVFIATINFVVAIVGTYLSDRGGTWSYAYLLGMITFVFLSSSILVEDDIWIGIYRAIMIAIGGCIGLFVSWIPLLPTSLGMKNITATDLAKAYLADALLDTSIAAQVVVDNFVGTGKQESLNPIHEIVDEEQDDEFHKFSKAIQVSRVPLEAALHASVFEGTSKSDVTSMRTSGLAIRLTLRCLLAADIILRQHLLQNKKRQKDDFSNGMRLDPSIKEEAQLGLALKGVVSAIRDTMLSHQMIDLNVTIRGGEEGSDDDESNDYDEESHPRKSNVTLSDSLRVLNSCLNEYIHMRALSSTDIDGGGDDDDDTRYNKMQRFACHVGFARNIYDAGVHFQEVLPHLIATDVGSVHVSSSSADFFIK